MSKNLENQTKAELIKRIEETEVVTSNRSKVAGLSALQVAEKLVSNLPDTVDTEGLQAHVALRLKTLGLVTTDIPVPESQESSTEGAEDQ